MNDMFQTSRTKSFLRHASRAAMVFALALSVVACDDIINDPTFRQWCGDTLCAWTLESGHIRKAPTWTDKDYGVEFVDTPTRISQMVTDSPKCLKFSTISDLDPSTQVIVSVDFDRDGTYEFQQPIPSVQWTEEETLVTAPKAYSGFTLTIEKQGNGHAVLAQMRVQSSDDCTAPANPWKGPLPIGDHCSTSDPSAAPCETGICCYGVCSECCGDKDCKVTLQTATDAGDGGDAAVPVSPSAICGTQPVSAPLFGLPGQCGPRDHLHKTGAPCLVGEDCASGVCDGAIIHGITGEPGEDAGTCNTLTTGCFPQSVAGGHCH